VALEAERRWKMTLLELKRFVELSVPVDGEAREWERLERKVSKWLKGVSHNGTNSSTE